MECEIVGSASGDGRADAEKSLPIVVKEVSVYFTGVKMMWGKERMGLRYGLNQKK